MDAPLIFLIAGEPSGDLIGARLMRALRRAAGGRVRFAGIGGEAMREEGLDSLFPISELSVMGVLEVLPRAPRLFRRMRETAAAARAARPAAMVSIDVPGFCFGVWRRLSGAGIPLIHYVAPSVWAWRPWRVRKFARRLDHLMTILPFEPPLFERAGLPATFVGHPVLESGADAGDGPGFRARHGIAPDSTVLCVMPGSRRGEIARHLEPFGDAVRRLGAARPGLVAVVPTVPAVADSVAAHCSRWAVPTRVVAGRTEAYDAMAAADLALVASGTATLELALAGVPMVVAYRVNPVTAALLRALLLVPHVSLVNVLLGRAAVPELLQRRCTGRALAAALRRLLDDPAARRDQAAACAEACRRLRPEDGRAPSAAAAALVLEAARAATGAKNDSRRCHRA